MLQLCNVQKHQGVKNEKNEKPKGELCRKKTKQLILSKVVLYFLELHCVPGATVVQF